MVGNRESETLRFPTPFVFEVRKERDQFKEADFLAFELVRQKIFEPVS